MDRTQGVLSFNNEIRNEHINRNIGVYFQYDGPMDPMIGEYYNIITRPLANLTNGKSLIDYTHDGENDYSESINYSYLDGKLDGHDVYDAGTLRYLNTWRSDYTNYLDYVMAVYVHEHIPIQFVDGLLSLSFMDKALQLMGPGIVRNIAPSMSLTGAVKTNINNFSGTDTKLGLITNQMYAASLSLGAIFNSDRQKTTTYIASRISTSLDNVYGNTLSNLNNLPNMISPNTSDGRVVEDYNNGIVIIDENNGNDFINLNKTRLSDALKYNKNQVFGKLDSTGTTWVQTKSGNFYAFDSKQYVDYESKTLNRDEVNGTYNHFVVINTNEFENSDKREVSSDDSHASFYGKMLHIVYQDDKHVIYSGSNNEFDSYEAVTERLEDAETDDENGLCFKHKSLLYKTNEVFNQHKIHTIYGEHPVNMPFGMGNFYDSDTTTNDTAKSKFGHSRGRNLLQREVNGEIGGDENGYHNPYCRTWTYHHQYDRVNKLIRPFTDENGNVMDLRSVQEMNDEYRSFIYKGYDEKGNSLSLKGGDYLADNTVLRKTGFVNITPSKSAEVDIKKCMFSIENLAWKDVPDRADYLKREQRGPNGGRIMWFPPYDINFQENVNVQWDSNTFIGRGEKVYTYSNTDRTGTLSFTMLIDYPSVLNDLHNEAGGETQSYYGKNGRADDKKDMEGDILRFFAGCMPLKYHKKRVQTPPKKTPPEGDKPHPETIRIYVFYPNNYSGHMFSKPENGDDDKRMKPDEDFAKYLILGEDTVIKSGVTVGYEMNISNERGISSGDDTNVIHPCPFSKRKSHQECNEEFQGNKHYRKDTSGNTVEVSAALDKQERLYRYRVDYDLKQPGLRVGNGIKSNSYYDSASYGLNCYIDQVTDCGCGNKVDASFTFAELYYALSKLRNSNPASGITGYTEEMKYIESKIGDKRMEYSTQDDTITGDTGNTVTRLQAICDIFTKDRKFVKIKLLGGATKQDPNNSSMLAFRRASSLMHFIDDAYWFRRGKEDKIEFEVNMTEVDTPEITYDRNSVSGYKPKRERYAIVEITYMTSGTKALSESDPNDREKDEQDYSKNAEKLYDYLRTLSEVLDKYDDLYDLTDDFVKWFSSEKKDDDNKTYDYRSIFTKEKIDALISGKTSSDIDEIHRIIYDFSEYEYISCNKIDVSGKTGYSEAIELSYSMSNSNEGLSAHTCESFETELAIVNDLSKMEELGDKILADEENISKIDNELLEANNKLNEAKKKLNADCEELSKTDEDFTSGTTYMKLVDNIKADVKNCRTKNDIVKEKEKQLEEVNKTYESDLTKLSNLIISYDEECYKLVKNKEKEIYKITNDEGTGKLDKLRAEISDVKNEIDEVTDKINEWAIDRSGDKKPYKTKLNVLKNKLKRLHTKITKLLNEEEEYIRTDEKNPGILIVLQNELNVLLEEYSGKVMQIRIASLGDTIYTFKKLYDEGLTELYSDMLISGSGPQGVRSIQGSQGTQGSSGDTGVFVDENYSYMFDGSNLKSYFLGNEVIDVSNKKYRFWSAYAIYLLIRWIEHSVAKIDGDSLSKTSDDLDTLYKYAVDAINGDKDFVYYITLLVVRERISKCPNVRFNVDGVLNYLIDIDKTIKLDDMPNTYSFIHYIGTQGDTSNEEGNTSGTQGNTSNEEGNTPEERFDSLINILTNKNRSKRNRAKEAKEAGYAVVKGVSFEIIASSIENKDNEVCEIISSDNVSNDTIITIEALVERKGEVFAIVYKEISNSEYDIYALYVPNEEAVENDKKKYDVEEKSQNLLNILNSSKSIKNKTKQLNDEKYRKHGVGYNIIQEEDVTNILHSIEQLDEVQCKVLIYDTSTNLSLAIRTIKNNLISNGKTIVTVFYVDYYNSESGKYEGYILYGTLKEEVGSPARVARTITRTLASITLSSSEAIKNELFDLILTENVNNIVSYCTDNEVYAYGMRDSNGNPLVGDVLPNTTFVNGLLNDIRNIDDTKYTIECSAVNNGYEFVRSLGGYDEFTTDFIGEFYKVEGTISDDNRFFVIYRKKIEEKTEDNNSTTDGSQSGDNGNTNQTEQDNTTNITNGTQGLISNNGSIGENGSSVNGSQGGIITGKTLEELSKFAIEEINAKLALDSSELSDKAQQALSEDVNNEVGTTISDNNENSNNYVIKSDANDVYHSDLAGERTENHRYETEAEYFSKLNEKDPIIFKRIKDKIKYFDPAFHSMSPEGFNARLTFLHQCTRQGQTIESHSSGDEYASVAGNLAFGRMPVCILRIGDFIYSRVLIQSMSISYGDGGMRWDLNPEGAGVQPMMAKISMPIIILGGQSLEGPVSRLQNAITFNYYANAGVYDDRADRAKPSLGYDEVVAVTNKDNQEVKDSNGNTVFTKKRTYFSTVEEAESNIRDNGDKYINRTNPVYGTNHYYTWSPDMEIDE